MHLVSRRGRLRLPCRSALQRPFLVRLQNPTNPRWPQHQHRRAAAIASAPPATSSMCASLVHRPRRQPPRNTSCRWSALLPPRLSLAHGAVAARYQYGYYCRCLLAACLLPACLPTACLLPANTYIYIYIDTYIHTYISIYIYIYIFISFNIRTCYVSTRSEELYAHHIGRAVPFLFRRVTILHLRARSFGLRSHYR